MYHSCIRSQTDSREACASRTKCTTPDYGRRRWKQRGCHQIAKDLDKALCEVDNINEDAPLLMQVQGYIMRRDIAKNVCSIAKCFIEVLHDTQLKSSKALLSIKKQLKKVGD